MDRERAPLADPALDRHPAAMSLDDVADDRQPEAAPLDVVHQAGTHAVEAVEDLVHLVARDADAVVADRDHHPSAFAPQRDRDLPAAAPRQPAPERLERLVDPLLDTGALEAVALAP